MKAVVMRSFGDFDVLQYEEVQTPVVKAGHVLIKILASGVNRLEHYIREGSVLKQLNFPHILGSDAVGEIAAIGDGVAGFATGDRVVAMPGYPLSDDDKDISPMTIAPSYAIGGIMQWGSYAEYILVPAAYVIHDNTGLKAQELATLPMVLVTGVQAVKEKGNVKAGDYVLIHAGSSGTGSASIQIAKALGAKVAATIENEAKREFVQALGADLIINTREKDFVGEIMTWTDGRGADLVVDNLGGDVIEKSIQAVKATGIVVAMGFVAGLEATFHVRNFFFGQKTIKGSLMGTVADFKFGLELVRKGLVKPQLDSALPLSQAQQAHRLLAGNAIKGNIVLIP